jgi:hypothetical protein
MKHGVYLLLIVLAACSDPIQPQKSTETRTAFERTDVDLRYLLKSYLNELKEYYQDDPGTTTDDFVRDTTNYVFTYDNSPNLGINLTRRLFRNDTTYLIFHKSFLEISCQQRLRLKTNVYLVHNIVRMQWECIGPFRELWNQQDLDAFPLTWSTNPCAVDTKRPTTM